jgi:ABC-type transporter Mla subunit MlaD
LANQEGVFQAESALRRLVFRLAALLFAFAVVGLIGACVTYVSRNHLLAPTYPLAVTFRNAQGVEAGASVTMAGVLVGRVESAGLKGQEALLNLRIEKGTRIPRGARFVAVPMMLNLSGSVQIVPPEGSAGRPVADALRPDEPDIHGDAGQGPTEALTQAQTLLSQLAAVTQKTSALLDSSTHTIDGINTIVRDGSIKHDIKATITNARTLSETGTQSSQQFAAVLAQTRSLLARNQAPSQRLVSNLANISGQVNTMTQDSRPPLATILADVRRTAASTARIGSRGEALLLKGEDIAAQGSDLLAREGIDRKWQTTLNQISDSGAELEATIVNLRSLTEKWNSLTASTQAIASDPAVARDFKETLAGLRSATGKLDAFAHNAQPLLDDPSVPEDVRTTLRNMRELSQISTTLLQQLSKVAGKK